MGNLPESEFATSEPEQNPPVRQRKSEAEGVKNVASNLKDGVSEQATASFESAKTNLKEAAQEAAGYSQGVVNEQKSRLAEIVQEYRQAAQAASEKLAEEGHPVLASRADEIASRLNRASEYLKERKLFDIYQDAERFTRRRPEIVFGVMFAAGLVAGRFLKASNRGVANSETSEMPGNDIVRSEKMVPSGVNQPSTMESEPGKML